MSTKRRRARTPARPESTMGRRPASPGGLASEPSTPGSAPNPAKSQSKLLVATSLLALSMLTACQRGCSHRSHHKGGTTPPPADTPGAAATPPKAPPGVQPKLRYVQQRLADGKFINPLAPPDPAPQATTEPALPDLPPINRHARVPPPQAPAGNHPCGAVQVGDDVIPLDCIDPDYLKIEHATRPLVTYHELHGGDMVLPRVVNHRDEGTEGAMRSQGVSLCCTAFSLASAVDHAYARWTGAPGAVSVMQVWGAYHTPLMGRAKATLDMGLAKETDWPFELKTANTWLDPQFCKKRGGTMHGTPCGREPDHSKLSSLASHPVAVITDIAALRDPKDTHAMKAKIAAGQDIWFAAKIGGHLSPKRLQGKPGSMYIPDFTPGPQDGGHAMLLVGYATLPHSTYFLIHNSWGPKWGDGGYAWIHEDTLKKMIGSAYVVDAEPAETVHSRRPPRRREEHACASGTLPDSISAECVPLCPDGSPRHNGVCASAGQCQKGYVNLTGACVRAAPTTRNRDAKEGVSWSCGPGGCAYEVAKGTGGCNADVCMISCPAPDYRLAHGRRGLTCVE